jgi:hypothetical protein
LPDEAWPKGARFHLSADRDLVADRIAAARKRKGEWPDAQLLSELHPLFRWLVDKVLVAFPRHTAPLLAADLPPGEVCWLCMGSFGNRRGQTWLAEWFGVRTPARGKPEVLDFQSFLAATGLGRNANRHADAEAPIPPAVARGLEPALAAARAHLAERFLEKKRDVAARRREFFQRLESWHTGAERLALAEKAKLRERGITKGPQYEAADQRLREIAARLQSRKDWAEQILEPASDIPYVRIAVAVTAPAGEGR